MCFQHEEKMTMSTKVTMAFVPIIIALAVPALAAGNGNRDNESTYKSAQYAYRNLMSFRARQGSTAERRCCSRSGLEPRKPSQLTTKQIRHLDGQTRVKRFRKSLNRWRE
jgi:hypothetical protein